MRTATRLAFLSLGLLTGGPVLAAPPPLQQLDFPVLAVGDSASFRVRVPAYAGGDGPALYAAFALMPGSDSPDLGYRFDAVDCGVGFNHNIHYDDRGVVCIQAELGAPHPAFDMIVSVYNVDAVEGETVQAAGLRSLIGSIGSTESPWFLYGAGR